MYEYMAELQERFQIVSRRTVRAKRDAQAAYDTLHAELNKEHQKLLLRLFDAFVLYREEKALDSFVTGFHLADSIRAELAAIPPYSFELEVGEPEQEVCDGRDR